MKGWTPSTTWGEKRKKPTAFDRAYMRGFMSALDWAVTKKNMSEVRELRRHFKKKFKKVI